MIDGKSGAPFARTPEFSKRKLIQHAVAGALAAGALVAVPAKSIRISAVMAESARLKTGSATFVLSWPRKTSGAFIPIRN